MSFVDVLPLLVLEECTSVEDQAYSFTPIGCGVRPSQQSLLE